MLYFLSEQEEQSGKSRYKARGAFNSILRQNEDARIMKREGWTEEQIANLPLEEQTDVERKSGRLFDDSRDNFLNVLAKAVSAFAIQEEER